MVQVTLTIQEPINKVSKNNTPFIKLNNEYTIFDEKVINFIKENVGKTATFEVLERNGFKNIKAVIGDAQASPTQPAIEVKQVAKELVKEEELILIRDKPNSRTFGKGSDQIKIYFCTSEDLQEQILALDAIGLMPNDWQSDKMNEMIEQPVNEHLE